MGSSCVPCTAPFHPSWPPCTAPNAGAKLLAPSDPFLLPCYGFLSPSENKQTCSCPTSNPPCHTCSDFISALSLPHLMGLTYQPHTGTSNFLPQVAWSSVRSLPPPACQDQPRMLSAPHARSRKATALGNGAGLRMRCHSKCVQAHRPALLDTGAKPWGDGSELPALGWHVREEPGWRGHGAAAAAGC